MKGICETAFITEAKFTQQVKELANLFGYLFYHTHRSQFSPSGYPDCTLIRLEPEPRLIFVELKVGNNQPTIDQYIWLEILQTIGKPVECYLWYPEDFDTICEVLK